MRWLAHEMQAMTEPYREPPPALFYCPKGCSPAWRTAYDEPCGHGNEREVYYRLSHTIEGDEPFRYCIYCNADCDATDPEHAGTCPSVTGRYPIEIRGPHPEPASCSRCERTFDWSDHFRLVKLSESGGIPGMEGMAPAPVYESVCDDCALADFTSEVPA